LTRRAEEYATLPQNTTIYMRLRSQGGVDMSDYVKVKVGANPKSIVLATKEVSIPVGGSTILGYTLYDAKGNVISLDTGAVIFTSNDTNIVRTNANKLIGCGSGVTSVTATLANDPNVHVACTVIVQDVPVDGELELRTEQGVLVTPDAENTLYLGKGEVLKFYVRTTEAAVAKYLSSVTANSDSNPYVRVSTTKQKDGTTLITLNALAVTPTDPAKPLPEVTLNVNSDLNEDGVSHGISIVLKLCVRAKPTSLKLNHTSYSFCTGDSFELIAMPMPQGDTANHYVFDVLDDSIVSVEEKAATDGNGHFMIKALKMGVTTVMISSTTDSRINAKCVITVGNKPTQITVKDKIITLAVGGSYQLEPMYVDAAGNQFGGTFKFALDAAGQQQSDYLSVDKNGMVTALKLPEDGARKQVMVSSKLWENDL
ncbi:MAG: hypothetical protein RSC98_09530, partial [Clostridia bacterium]